MSLSNPYYVPTDAVGVLGVPEPSRTEYDKRMQAEYSPLAPMGGVEKYGNPGGNQTGNMGAKQKGSCLACMGMKNTDPTNNYTLGVPPSHVTMNDFGPRTLADQRMLLEFDPYISENFQRQRVKERYCGAPVSQAQLRGQGGCVYAQTSDNPYNPAQAIFRTL